MIKYIIENRHQYAHVFAPVYERIPIYYLYYTKNLSAALIGKVRFGLQIDQVDNVQFVKDWCPSKFIPPEDRSQHLLIVDNADCEAKSGLQELKRIVRSDSTEAYRIYSLH